jgi:hypothetical protein
LTWEGAVAGDVTGGRLRLASPVTAAILGVLVLVLAIVTLTLTAVAIDAYIGKGARFAAAIGRFAGLYADQNERDHAQLVNAIAAGMVESLPG